MILKVQTQYKTSAVAANKISLLTKTLVNSELWTESE